MLHLLISVYSGKCYINKKMLHKRLLRVILCIYIFLDNK